MMMQNQITITVGIKAPVHKVWRVFTDPEVTQQMGGYYETDWKAGSSFGFKNMNGDLLTKGILLACETERWIDHSLFEPGSENVMAVLSYEFLEEKAYTLLTGKEVLTHTPDQETFDHASAGWKAALNQVKEIAESL